MPIASLEPSLLNANANLRSRESGPSSPTEPTDLQPEQGKGAPAAASSPPPSSPSSAFVSNTSRAGATRGNAEAAPLQQAMAETVTTEALQQHHAALEQRLASDPSFAKQYAVFTELQ